MIAKEKEVLISWGRSNKLGINQEMLAPRIILNEDELEEEIKKKGDLISSFNDGINEISDFVKGKYFFLLCMKIAI
ncbi:hypothetical protein [Halonatronum saccharophilum]|uniref:hypothetical protein n=1 Tax=Halonatronum saccharophilum TaxID=150060 RepID=UPI0004889983|nr:hypothetical protein [Halonatronum saccharophilum]